MGLDMYLYKKHYIGNQYKKSKDKLRIINKRKLNIKDKNISEITENIAYWRKANQIHKWFVDNIQKGQDNCKEYNVNHDSLQKLLTLIIKVLDNHSEAKNLLPNQEGFFFGSQDYDSYYFEDLEYTKKTLEKILKTPDENYTYQSSW